MQLLLVRKMAEPVDESKLKVIIDNSVEEYKKANKETFYNAIKARVSIDEYIRDFKLADIENVCFNTMHGCILTIKEYCINISKVMYIYILDNTALEENLYKVANIYSLLNMNILTREDVDELRAMADSIQHIITNEHGLLMPEHILLNFYRLERPQYKEIDDSRIDKYVRSHKRLCIYSVLYKKITECWSHLFNDDEKQYIALTLAGYNAKILQFSKTMDILNEVYFTEDKPADYAAIISSLYLTPWKIR